MPLSPDFIYLYITLVAAIIGSFLNMLTYRLPLILQRQWRQQASDILDVSAEETDSINLFFPASHCPHCKVSIPWYYNIPIAGFFLSRCRCQSCQQPIPLRYLWLELFTVAISWLLMFKFPWGPQLAALLVASWMLTALAVIDLETGFLPDQITLPLLWLGLITSSLGITATPLVDALWGALMGYLLLWSLYWIMKLLTAKEGMGYGDFKLLAAIGAWLGWLSLPLALLLASISALGYILYQTLITKRKQWHSKHRFGPFLALGFWVTLLWGDTMIAIWF